MKCHSARGASLAVLLALTSTAWCQDTGRNLFPLPPLPPIGNGYAVVPAAANDALWGQAEPSPVQTSPLQSPAQIPMPSKDHSVVTPDYVDAMKGGYEGCASTVGTTCGGTVCCNNHYVYANALIMSLLKPGGYVTSVDEFTFEQRLNFCNQEFGKIWNGGFELGAGWCLNGGCGGCGGCGCGGCGGGGCGNTAVEMVYWGLFPATATITHYDDMNSTINFDDLDYNGGNANDSFTSAPIHRITYDYTFHSVEASLVGNSWNGGPFGCGMCGGGGGSPWGFGYTVGLRYINFSENFVFSSDPNDFDLSGDPAELNYLIQTNNNLFGAQAGVGLSYTVTDRFTAYAISKFGIYGNSVSMLQRVYGPSGNAIINNGSHNNEPFVVRTAPKCTLGLAGQFDLGGRWAVTDAWSVNFGYRVLGLAGVATTDTNIAVTEFQDVDGIAAVQRTGSAMIHGAFAGATYCW